MFVNYIYITLIYILAVKKEKNKMEEASVYPRGM